MRLSARTLRLILLGGVVLLACVLAAVFGLANYRAGKTWQRILARNGVNLRQETDGYTYSQSDGKRTVFTLHAAKAVPQGKGKYSLKEAVLVLYGKDGRTDRVYGNQFDYDQEAGVARAIGEVHMDLEAPAAEGKDAHAGAGPSLGFTPGDASVADPGLIHVRTSGLVYTRKLGIAATDEPAEFRYRAMTCRSRGAAFDADTGVLQLQADVHLEGTVRKAPFALSAAHADLDRGANTVHLWQPVWVSKERRAGAQQAVFHLRSGGSVETGEAEGMVSLRSGSQQIEAARLEAGFGGDNRPQNARFSGGVRFADTDPQRPGAGAARDLALEMSAAGVLRSATADGGVTYTATSPSGAGPTASRQMRGDRAVASFDPPSGTSKGAMLRTVHLRGAAEMVSDRLSDPRSDRPGADRPGADRPGADGSGETAEGGRALTRVEADDLVTTFAGRGRTPQPRELVGGGHTQLEQRGPEGQHQVSTADALRISFAERAGGAGQRGGAAVELASATQTGHVVLRSWSGVRSGVRSGVQSGAGNGSGAIPPSPFQVGSEAGGDLTVGHAAQAVFQAGEGTLTLTGDGQTRADVYDGGTQLSAPTIVLHQSTGDGEAGGGVLATTGGENEAPATHVLAAHAALLHRAGISQFFGTNAQPARLWQEGSQVEAAKLVLDGPHHTLSARPDKGGAVHAVFASAGTGSVRKPGRSGKDRTVGPEDGPGRPLPEAKNAPEASRDAVEIRAATMDYNDAAREATFAGNVHMQGAAGEVTGREGAAFLTPVDGSASASGGTLGANGTDFGGKLQRFVVLGDVHLAQPGRVGTGEQVTYTAASNSFVLTGSGAHLPRVQDAQQGLVTGATLVFGVADRGIVVAGAGAGKQVATQTPEGKGKPARVHTETDLKPQ